MCAAWDNIIFIAILGCEKYYCKVKCWVWVELFQMKTKELYPNWTLLNFSNVQHLPYHFQSWLLVYKFPCFHKTYTFQSQHGCGWSINNPQMQWIFKCTQFKTGSISSLHVFFSYPFFDAWSRWNTRLTCEPLQTKISMQKL